MPTSQAATLKASTAAIPAQPARTSPAKPALTSISAPEPISTAAPAPTSIESADRETVRTGILLMLGSVAFLIGVTLLINALFANLV